MRKLPNRLSAFFSRGAGAPSLQGRVLRLIVPILLVLLVVGGLGSGWAYTNSPEFCGTVCHSMPPEYVAYQSSPHARVACVDCHIGGQGIVTRLSRKVGEVRHVTSVFLQDYELPVYARSMRPASETCEQCHSPEKISDRSVRELARYATDETNTLTTNYVAMKTGGSSERLGLEGGIHWHVHNEVWYIALDELRQEIPWVRLVGSKGDVIEEYVDIAADFDPALVDQYQMRRMDCMDCHNRISHTFRTPEEAVDLALSQRRISPDIPGIKAKAVALLSESYDSYDQAMAAIVTLDSYYAENFPEYYNEGHYLDIQEAIEALQAICQENVFPTQGVDWDTHPDNSDHRAWPGCFRCHDGKHLSDDGQAIRLACNLCHTVPTVARATRIALGNQDDPGSEEERKGSTDVQEVLLPLSVGSRPISHQDPSWLLLHETTYDDTCQLCHDVGEDPESAPADDASFCGNSACHATEWTYAGLDTPGLLELVTPPHKTVEEIEDTWESSDTQARTHLASDEEEIECESCHNAEWPPEGPPPTSACLDCHEKSYEGMTALTKDSDPNPHDWHMGELTCDFCHINHDPYRNPCYFCH